MYSLLAGRRAALAVSSGSVTTQSQIVGRQSLTCHEPPLLASRNGPGTRGSVCVSGKRSDRYKSRSKWVASISVNNKRVNLGYYATAIEAARAYDEAAKAHFGSFALINGV